MAFSPTLPVTRDALVTKAVRMYGLDNDTELTAIALEFLDDAVKAFNSYLFEFNKTAETGIALVSGTKEYELTGSGFYREVNAYLVKTTGSTKQEPMHYMPYAQFCRLVQNDSNNTSTGEPYVYTARNIHNDGKVRLFPTPDASTASAFTLTVEYYTRLPLLSALAGGSSQLNVPQEVETALVFGAQKRLAIHIKGPADPDVAALDALEQRALAKLIAIDRHHPDSNTRFKIATPWRRSRRAGDVLVRLA